MTKTKLNAYQQKFKTEGINVNGCHIKDNNVYTVVSKTPLDAPDVYKYKLQSEKERMPFVSNLKTFSTVNGITNNGFHPQSSVFNEMGIDEYSQKEEKAEEFEAIFLEPIKGMMTEDEYEMFKKPRAYEIYETENFQNLVNVDVREGRQFNTSIPIDRFHLYIAALTGGIVEKGRRTSEERKEGYIDENESRAQYAYTSKEKVRSNKENASLERMKAMSYFTLLNTEDKELLVDLINFNFDVKVNKTDSEDKIYVTFDTGILHHFDSRGRIKRFLSEYEDYAENKQQYKDMLKVYADLLNRGNEVITSTREVVVGDVTMPNLKTAARKISKDKKLMKDLYDILDKGARKQTEK